LSQPADVVSVKRAAMKPARGIHRRLGQRRAVQCFLSDPEEKPPFTPPAIIASSASVSSRSLTAGDLTATLSCSGFTALGALSKGFWIVIVEAPLIGFWNRMDLEQRT
jgi:hypothetical protein